MRSQAGFTLFELIIVVTILGLVAVFAGIFITTGVRGSVAARQAEENAQRGQIALQRISLELRDVNGGSGVGTAPTVSASPPSIGYSSSQTALDGPSGVRTLAYDAANKRITLTPASGVAQILVDGVETCAMTTSGASTTYDIVFTVTFTLTGTNASFSITVKPRNAISTPVSS